MGPEGGDGGGTVAAQGTPEQIAADGGSHTGRFLREVLARRSVKRDAAAGEGAAKLKTARAKAAVRQAAE